MQDVDSGEGIKGEGDGGCEEKAEKGAKIKNPCRAAGPFPSLDIHDRPGEEETEQETEKREQGLQIDAGQLDSPPFRGQKSGTIGIITEKQKGGRSSLPPFTVLGTLRETAQDCVDSAKPKGF